MTDELKSKILNLNEMINYQEGAVVSRTIFDKDKSNLTVFAFAKDQGLSEHTSPYDAIVQITDGEADIFIEGTQHTLTKDQMIIMPANKPHSLKAKTNFKMLLTMIRG